MSIGTVTKLTSAASLEGLDPKLALMARAALGAGYAVENRCLRFQDMLFVDNKHFHPLTNWQQCVRMIVDTGSEFTICEGAVSIYSPGEDLDGPPVDESRTPVTDAEYREQMCEAVVTNIAKACPF